MDTRPSMRLDCGCVAAGCPCCPDGVVVIADRGSCQVNGSALLHQILLERAQRAWTRMEALLERAHDTPCDGGAR